MARVAPSLVAVVALAACSTASPGSPVAAISPSAVAGSSTAPAETPSPTQIASATASPSSFPDLPVTPLGLSCRLPVMVTTQYADGAKLEGGFLTFPAATSQTDPNGVVLPQTTGMFVATATPLLRGVPETGPPFYDLALNRWLPVGSGQTAPDGRSYAYSVPGATGSDLTVIHVVDVATGADRTISIAPPPAGAAVGWSVADYDGKSVYLVGDQIDQYPAGVWQLDATTGAMRDLNVAGHVLLVQDGTAWIGLVNPSDPTPPMPAKGQAFDSIVAVNLTSGARTTWAYDPGISIQLFAVDWMGRPLVGFAPPPDFSKVSMLYIPSPGAPVQTVSAPGRNLAFIEPDLNRFWFGGSAGIYYWTGNTGLIKVYAFNGNPAQRQSIAPAGHCV